MGKLAGIDRLEAAKAFAMVFDYKTVPKRNDLNSCNKARSESEVAMASVAQNMAVNMDKHIRESIMSKDLAKAVVHLKGCDNGKMTATEATTAKWTEFATNYKILDTTFKPKSKWKPRDVSVLHDSKEAQFCPECDVPVWVVERELMNGQGDCWLGTVTDYLSLHECPVDDWYPEDEDEKEIEF